MLEQLQAHADFDAHRAGAAQCARLMQRAIQTLRALPERDRHREIGTGWPDVVRDVFDAYGWNDARMPRFKPTPHDVSVMLDVLSWITWLEQQNDGKRDARIIVARAFGVAWWLIGTRFGRNERTVRRWYEGAVAIVYARFRAQVFALTE